MVWFAADIQPSMTIRALTGVTGVPAEEPGLKPENVFTLPVFGPDTTWAKCGIFRLR